MNAKIETATGNRIIIANAFMLGMDHIVGERPEIVYTIQDGDKIVFA